MIVQVPKSADFAEAGISLLNLSWDTVSSLYMELENGEVEEWDDDGTVTDEFWAAAQRPLANAVTLVLQGAEFLLKGRIAEVSPYLLLLGPPREWPGGCAEQDTPFAAFRTIDAQDLTRVHDSVRTDRLDRAFRGRIDEMRTLRNSIMHSVDKQTRHAPSELWTRILDIYHFLVGPSPWMTARREYLIVAPSAVAYGDEHISWQVTREALKLLELLEPAAVRLYLGVEKKKRFHTCRHCQDKGGDYDDMDPETAQLRPANSTATKIYCFVCGQEDEVLRVSCSETGCRGRIILAATGICVECGERQQ